MAKLWQLPALYEGTGNRGAPFLPLSFLPQALGMVRDWLHLVSLDMSLWATYRNIKDWWYDMVSIQRIHGRAMASLTMLVCKTIWDERNARVFRSKSPPPQLFFFEPSRERRGFGRPREQRFWGTSYRESSVFPVFALPFGGLFSFSENIVRLLPLLINEKGQNICPMFKKKCFVSRKAVLRYPCCVGCWWLMHIRTTCDWFTCRSFIELLTDTYLLILKLCDWFSKLVSLLIDYVLIDFTCRVLLLTVYLHSAAASVYLYQLELLLLQSDEPMFSHGWIFCVIDFLNL